MPHEQLVVLLRPLQPVPVGIHAPRQVLEVPAVSSGKRPFKAAGGTVVNLILIAFCYY